MKELILYYSLTGTTHRYAEAMANETGAELRRIRLQKEYSTLGAYTRGILGVFRDAKPPIADLKVDLNDYDRITLIAPVWASYQAPPASTAVGLLPEGKQVNVILVSKSGNSEHARIRSAIEARGCELLSVEDVRESDVK